MRQARRCPCPAPGKRESDPFSGLLTLPMMHEAESTDLGPPITPEQLVMSANPVIAGRSALAERLLRREQSSAEPGNPHDRHGLPLGRHVPGQPGTRFAGKTNRLPFPAIDAARWLADQRSPEDASTTGEKVAGDNRFAWPIDRIASAVERNLTPVADGALLPRRELPPTRRRRKSLGKCWG